MKLFVSMLAAVCCLFTVAAQEVTEPRFEGADAQRYMTRLVGELEKLIVPGTCPMDRISPVLRMRCTIDTTGVLSVVRYLDRTGVGRDYRDSDPVTPETREFIRQAAAQLETWTPARNAEGKPVTHTMTMSIRLPVGKMMQKRDLLHGTPLLFDGQDPRESFHRWARVRLRCEEGLTSVRFYVEPDGSVTIDKVIESPSARNAKEVVRVIRNSKGRWTPKKLNGVPIRSVYEYRINTFKNEV